MAVDDGALRAAAAPGSDARVTTRDDPRGARALGLLATLATAGSQGHTDATL
ncbi:MAG: hypothetical protein JWM10_4943, partial [Myxococcaceae bacterium]|nr:hypothetical protein [Myxococcaceae bacterium]